MRVNGLTIDKGDLLVTAASNVTGPPREVSGLPKWRRPQMTASLTPRRLASLILGASMLAAVPALGAASPGLGPNSHVTICHATGSKTNPYVKISPSVAGILNGHLKHQDHRDVVPPFTFRGQTYPGQNWTADGQTFLAGGCSGPFSPGQGGGIGGGGNL